MIPVPMKFYVVVLTLTLAPGYDTAVPDASEQVPDVCLKGKHHKEAPGPESALYKCDPWKEYSCCTNDTASIVPLYNGPLYGFNYNHCENMSKKCFDRFTENHCFYECSPNVGLWLIPVDSSYRRQRFENVPLCRSQCEAWWDDCKHDSTCVDNWSSGFEWSNNTNVCPKGKICKRFDDIFKDSIHFCEQIFGPKDYKVVDDKFHCMQLRFNGTNPNPEVAKYYASHKDMLDSTGTEAIPSYVPPSPIPALKVHGTLASIVIAILILISLFCVLVYCGVRYYRRQNFRHQGIPVQFPSVLATRITRHKTSNSIRHHDRDAEMSFMQYEEEDDDETGPEMNGTLRVQL